MKEEPLSFEELQLFNRRDLIIRSVLTVPFAAIVWRLWNLQVKNGKTYKELSKGNRIRLKSLAAPRGIVYDRNGVIVAKNIPSYILNLVREDVPDIDEVLTKISLSLQIPIELLRRNLQSQLKTARFVPIQIHKDLTLRQIALIETYQEQFPGISIEVMPRRYYPLLSTGAHVFGYMSEITKAQLKKLPENKIKSAKIIGQEGIEAVYNEHLIGTDGGMQVEVNNAGREIRTYPGQIDPKPGNDIILSIDSVLQRQIEKIMGKRRGAVIVMSPNTGEVLAMVSLPAFDPNEFSQGLSVKRWRELRNDPGHVLNNKCIQGIYSPGSTFKMVTAAAALESGIVSPDTEIKCDGFIRLKRTKMHCWKRSGHGYLNVVQAIEHSCNVFFYKVAMEMGIEKIKEYANRFGLGSPSGVDLLSELSGVVPDREWKLKRYKQEWQKGETPNVAIGQGYLSVTPIQLISYINAIANGGFFVKPRIVKQYIDNESLTKIGKLEPGLNLLETKIEKREIDIKPETLDLLRQGMERNVQGEKGTGRRARSGLVAVAGKTGTTEVISSKTRDKILKEQGEVAEKFQNHAWFTAFAPVEDPMISMVVMVEHGSSGSNSAAIARQIIDYYFTNIESVPKSPLENLPLKTEELGNNT